MSPSFVFRLRERERELRTSLDPTWRSQLAVHWFSMFACYDVYNELEFARDQGPWVG